MLKNEINLCIIEELDHTRLMDLTLIGPVGNVERRGRELAPRYHVDLT